MPKYKIIPDFLESSKKCSVKVQMLWFVACYFTMPAMSKYQTWYIRCFYVAYDHDSLQNNTLMLLVCNGRHSIKSCGRHSGRNWYLRAYVLKHSTKQREQTNKAFIFIPQLCPVAYIYNTVSSKPLPNSATQSTVYQVFKCLKVQVEENFSFKVLYLV